MSRLRVWARRRTRGGDDGAVAVLVAILAVVLFGCAALAVDLGSAWAMRRKAQTAADAAALAGANVVGTGNPSTTAGTYATNNGFSGATVNVPPLSGSNIGNVTCVEVVVNQTVNTIFAGTMGIANMTIGARAVACKSPGTGPCGLCVLSPTAAPALSGTGNGSFNVIGSGVVVNSTASTAAQLVGNGSVTGTVVGGPAAPNGFKTTGNAEYDPPPVNMGAVPDPLAGVPMCPGAGTPNPCPTTNRADVNLTGLGSQIISPGIYTNISLTGNGTLTMLPGTYIIKGSLNLTGNGAVIANGVTFYFACSSYPTPCNSNQSGANFSLTGNGSLNVTAPATGAFQGLSIFSDRNNAASSSLTGNGAAFGGTVYMKSGRLTLTGNGQTLNSRVIVDRVVLTGNGSMNINANASGNVQILGVLELSE